MRPDNQATETVDAKHGHDPSAGIRFERGVAIPMQDGVELKAVALLPEGDGPFPVLLSFYPYLKDSLTGVIFGPWSRYFASHGYATLLVDLRGTGASGGEPGEPFDVAREGADGAAAVEWARAQPWCDGNVGVYGMSYGGITALSTAARRPAGLRAIATVVGLHDAYRDFFYPGGAERCLGPALWGTTMVALQLAPPAVATSAEDHGRWREGLEEVEPYLFPWRDRPNCDDYWRTRAVDLAAIEAPTFVIGGWHDLFPEAFARVYEGIAAERRLLIGPWAHETPSSSPTEPVDEMVELRRWFDRWMRGESVAEGEPPVTVYVQGAGVWRQEDDWPPPAAEESRLYPTASGGLGERPEAEPGARRYVADPTVGLRAGHQEESGRPDEQSEDDARAMTFTGEPLAAPLELTGSAEAVLWVALAVGEEANLAVRLCDVDSSDRSTLIARGRRRVGRRGSSPGSPPAKRGELVEVRIELDPCAYALDKGHRLRLSVACADFPNYWPTPESPEIELRTGGGEQASHLRLTTLPAGGRLTEPIRPPASEGSEELPPPLGWVVERDPDGTAARCLISGDVCAENLAGERVEIGERVEAEVREDPAEAEVNAAFTLRQTLPDMTEAVVEARTRLVQDAVECSARISVGAELVFERSWSRRGDGRT